MTRTTKQLAKYGGVVAVAALALSAILGTATGAQTLQPFSQLSIVDANGKAVGKFIELYKGNSDSALVALEANDVVFELFVHHDGFESYGYGPCSESADCSGPAFSCDCGYPTLLGAATPVIGPPGNTLYLPAAGATPRQATLQSMLSPGSCQSFGFSSPCDAALQVQPVLDLDTVFTLPFRLVASATSGAAQCCGDCNGDGAVTINEIITSVNYALGQCPAQ